MTIPTAVVLLTYMGVGFYNQPISVRVWFNSAYFLAVMNKEANSAFATDDIIYLIILGIVRISLLNSRISTSLEIYIYTSSTSSFRLIEIAGI